MGLFNFFKKTTKHLPAAPAAQDEAFVYPIPESIKHKIDEVQWENYESAYGNAKEKIPQNLKMLFSDDKEQATDATHQLWCSLCHQHVYISSAALPAYNILKQGLLTLDDDLKLEILDILIGFAYCSTPELTIGTYKEWAGELRKKMIEDQDIFRTLSEHQNEDIAKCSKEVLEKLVFTAS